MIFTDVDFSWLWGSLIGVGGTILGAVLGWLFTKRSNKKLDIRVIKTIIEDPVYSEKNGVDSLDYIDVKTEILVYNPSDITKMIDKITFEMSDKTKKIVYSKRVFDLENTQVIAGSFFIPQNFSLENIPPHFGVKLHIEFVLESEILKIRKNIKKSFFSYTNEKHKKNKVAYRPKSIDSDICFEKQHPKYQNLLKTENDD